MPGTATYSGQMILDVDPVIPFNKVSDAAKKEEENKNAQSHCMNLSQAMVVGFCGTCAVYSELSICTSPLTV